MTRGFPARRITFGYAVWWLLAGVVKVTFRFLFGLPLDGKRRTDCTFFARGTMPAPGLPDYWGTGKPTWWSKLAGWERMAIRLGCIGVAVAWWLYPTPTTIAAAILGGSLVIYGGCRVAATILNWRHYRDTVDPLYAELAHNYLKTAPAERDQWLTVPRDWHTNRTAVAQLVVPAELALTDTLKSSLDKTMRRHLGKSLDMKEPRTDLLEWHHAPAPPARVEYREAIPAKPSEHEFPTGVGIRETKLTVSTQTESPNGYVTGGPGSGKTTVLRGIIAWARKHGWLVDVIDLKSSMPEYEDVPGVRVHTTMQDGICALSEYVVSMVGAHQARKAGRIDHVTKRLLVFDEFGSFMRLTRSWWKRNKSKEDPAEPPFLHAFLLIGYQGREGEHRMAVGVHSPLAKLFGDSDARDLFDWKLMLGPFSGLKKRMVFGKADVPDYDATIKGRGVLGRGETDVREIQAAFISPDDAVDLAGEGPAAPAWFVNGERPPWVTPEVVARTIADVGIWEDWLPSPRRVSAEKNTTSPADFEGDTPQSSPEDDPANVPPRNSAASTGVHPFGTNEDGRIVGTRNAAAFLSAEGWPMTTKQFTDARKSARKRGRPIPGETTVTDEQGRERPSWAPADLLAWHKSRPSADKTKRGKRSA